MSQIIYKEEKIKKLVPFFAEHEFAECAIEEAVKKVNEYFEESTHVIQSQSHSVVATEEGFCATIIVLIEDEIADRKKKIPKFNIGDDFFRLNEHKNVIEKGTIKEISLGKEGFAYCSDIYSFTDDDIGVDVFSSEEAANAKLRRIINGNR